MSLFFACKDSDNTPINPYNYYPLEIGRYQIYDITQVTYSVDIPDSTTTSWQERDVVDRIAQQGENSTTYIVARYQRNTNADAWKKIKEFSVESTPDKTIQSIDNNSVVSLFFPIREKFSWNGNMYNTNDEQKFIYSNINTQQSVDSQTFPNTVSVNERDETSVIGNYVSNKSYGLDAGLIYSEDTAFEYCQDDDCIGNFKVESGSHTIKKINSYGVLL